MKTDQSLAVYVPSMNRAATLTEDHHADLADHVAMHMAKEFGGATITPGRGWWKDNAGALLREKVLIVRSFIPQDKAHAITSVVDKCCALIHSIVAQDAIGVEINGSFEVVPMHIEEQVV
jgi:hypothetical protein